MPVSHFDQMSHRFHCQNVKCRNLFSVVLRQLLKADKVVCPECGHAINIRDSKKRGAIRKDFDTAERLDIEAAQEK
jgi:transcription initiation factor IIE alpha subunit